MQKDKQMRTEKQALRSVQTVSNSVTSREKWKDKQWSTEGLAVDKPQGRKSQEEGNMTSSNTRTRNGEKKDTQWEAEDKSRRRRMDRHRCILIANKQDVANKIMCKKCGSSYYK